MHSTKLHVCKENGSFLDFCRVTSPWRRRLTSGTDVKYICDLPVEKGEQGCSSNAFKCVWKSLKRVCLFPFSSGRPRISMVSLSLFVRGLMGFCCCCCCCLFPPDQRQRHEERSSRGRRSDADGRAVVRDADRLQRQNHQQENDAHLQDPGRFCSEPERRSECTGRYVISPTLTPTPIPLIYGSWRALGPDFLICSNRARLVPSSVFVAIARGWLRVPYL